MKINHKSLIVIAAVAAVSASGVARAQIVGIDFYQDSTNSVGSGGQAPGATAVVGPYASAGWNNEYNLSGFAYGGTSLALTDSTSAPAGTFSFTEGGNALDGSPINNSAYGATGSANGSLTPTEQLYNGEAQAAPGGFVQEVNLTSIPYASYDVYLLVQDTAGGNYVPSYGSVQMFTGTTAGSTYWFQHSNDSFGADTGTPISSYVQATGTSMATATDEANYVEFTGLAGGAGTSYSFDLSVPGDLSYQGNAYIAGIEIVDTASVPEPSTYALMLGGLGMLVMFARRRQLS